MSARRGFAVIPRDQVRAYARRGGARGHELGTAHEWTVDEARSNGRLGGLAKAARARAARETKRHEVQSEA